MIYLDANSNLPLSPLAAKAMQDTLALYGNPASVHSHGRAMRQAIDDARLSLKKLLGASSARIVFTSGGTEANNLAIKGLQAPALITSPVEHASVRNVTHPHKIVVPVGRDGLIDLVALENALQKSPPRTLISIGWVNSETGVIQPIQKIAEIAHNYDALLHTDAVQAAGKLPVSFEESGADLMSLSAHKCGGPVGCGAVIMKESLHLHAILEGGGHEYGMRSGTLAAHQIVGFVEGLKDTLTSADSWNTVEKLRDHLESCVISAVGYVVASTSPRIGNTSCIVMPGVESSLQVMNFDLSGFAVSAGSACSSGKVKTSPVLAAMDLPQGWAECAIRVSLSPQNTDDEINLFIAEWQKLRSRQNVA